MEMTQATIWSPGQGGRRRLLTFSTAIAALAVTGPAFAAPQQAPKLCPAAIRTINAAAAKTMRQGSPGMIVEVARNGELLFSGTYGMADLEHGAPVNRETVFKLASITKQFTAAITLSLVEEGKLKLDDRLAKHVPELPVAAGVRIYDLLVHTSGIPDYSEDRAGEKNKSVERSRAEMLAWIGKLTPQLAFQPGSRWAYSNSNYTLLGLIAERVSGRSLDELFRERLFKPAGMVATAFDNPTDVVPHRADGYRRAKDSPTGFRHAAWISPTIPGPAGGLRGTARDIIRWNHALFGGKILKEPTLRSMIAPGLLADGRTTMFGMPEDWQKGMASDYALGFFIKRTKAGVRIGHPGDVDGFSTWAAHYPASGVTIVQLINSQSADLNVDEVEAAVFPASADPCLKR
jgi:CubicO group peptidase (beta-lactamase class C family)